MRAVKKRLGCGHGLLNWFQPTAHISWHVQTQQVAGPELLVVYQQRSLWDHNGDSVENDDYEPVVFEETHDSRNFFWLDVFHKMAQNWPVTGWKIMEHPYYSGKPKHGQPDPIHKSFFASPKSSGARSVQAK